MTDRARRSALEAAMDYRIGDEVIVSDGAGGKRGVVVRVMVGPPDYDTAVSLRVLLDESVIGMTGDYSLDTVEPTLSTRQNRALERIAAALEATNAADPLTMLDAVMQEGDGSMLVGDPKQPTANNGYTYTYQHPDPASGLEIVARRDNVEPGGYRVSVEPK